MGFNLWLDSSSTPAYIPIKRPNGTKSWARGPININQMKSLCLPADSNSINYYYTTDYHGIKVGAGNTSPGIDDYCLESMITSGLSMTVTSVTRSAIDETPSITLVISVTNTSNSDITIKEIGYQGSVNGTNIKGATSQTTYYPLLDRTLLDSPITIPSNETATISYTLTGPTFYALL